MLRILVYFILCTSIKLYAAQVVEKPKKISLELDYIALKSSLNLDIVESDSIKARIFGYQFNIIIKDKISSEVDIFFDGLLNLQVGSNDVVGSGTAEFQPINTVDLNEGGLRYRPWSFLTLKAGAINQDEFASPLFLSSTAFAAAQEVFHYNGFSLKLQQAIPTNNRLQKRIAVNVDSGTPYLNTTSIAYKYKGHFYFHSELTQYYYQDLSSTIADNSSSFGNSVQDLGSAKKFTYNFSGQNLMLKIGKSFGLHRFYFNGQYLYNDKAPEKRNRGNLAALEYYYKSFGVMLETFRNESDTAPAFYNSKYYGHNNVQGNAFALKYKIKDFESFVRYADIDVIEETLVQYPTQILSFLISKTYTF